MSYVDTLRAAYDDNPVALERLAHTRGGLGPDLPAKRNDELPDAEWQKAADAEPYRIASTLFRRLSWHVVDIRPIDEPTVAGPYRTREEALAAADRMNLLA
jgi:hypothetical protein